MVLQYTEPAFADYKILKKDGQDKLLHSVYAVHVNKMYIITMLWMQTKIMAFKTKFTTTV
jgi:hypothetical protein